MAHRLVNVPMAPSEYSCERNTILAIAKNNGFPTDIVLRIIKRFQNLKIQKLLYSPGPTPEGENRQYRKIPYLGSLSNVVGNQLLKLGIRPTFYSRGTIGRLLVNNKLDVINKNQSSGVYKIQCSDCLSSYIGQTGRTFETRFKEHTKTHRNNEVRNEGPSSSFSNHLLDTGHNCDIQNLKILHVESKGQKLNALESVEIVRAQKRGENLLNEQLDFCMSPLLRLITDYNWNA